MCDVIYSHPWRHNVLQCVAACYNAPEYRASEHLFILPLATSLSTSASCVCCSVLQYVAVCCSVLQCVTVCCSLLHCAAVCCSVLQCAVVFCSVSQCAAVFCSVLQHVELYPRHTLLTERKHGNFFFSLSYAQADIHAQYWLSHTHTRILSQARIQTQTDMHRHRPSGSRAGMLWSNETL